MPEHHHRPATTRTGIDASLLLGVRHSAHE